MKKKRRTGRWICLLMLGLLLTGCGQNKIDEEKIRDMDYTVTSEDRLPEELKELIERKKAEPFKMTYRDGDYLYICQGYGTQPTGGYSIQVKDVYMTSNAVYFSSCLTGPLQTEMKIEKETTPYIVIKVEYQDMTVVFD